MNTGIVKLTPELMSLIASSYSGGAGVMPFTREIFLLDIVVAGTSFCEQIEEIVPKLAEGTVLKMIRDPKNEHDEMAIAIYYDSVRIGWIPAELNEVISRLMDAGKAFFCRVVGKTKHGNWNKIKAKVYMVE